MPDCILHFGLPKTGTTAIQRALSGRGVDPRILYSRFQQPLHDDGNHSRAIVTAFSGRPERFHAHEADAVSAEALAAERVRLLERIAAEIAGVGDRTLVLSAESTNFLTSEEVGRMAVFLAERRLSTRAVGYVRPLRAYRESLFVQIIKQGPVRLAFIRTVGTSGPRQLVENLDTAFGRERVDLWKYDRATFPGGCVVADFCARIGIVCPRAVQPDANRSLSLPAVRFLHAYRLFGEEAASSAARRYREPVVVAALRDLLGPPFRLHPSLSSPLRGRQAADLDWLEDRVGGSLRDGMDDDAGPSIASEEDLLDFSAGSLDWLARHAGVPASALSGGAPPAVAAAVGRLFEITASRRHASRGLRTRIGNRLRAFSSRLHDRMARWSDGAGTGDGETPRR